MVPQEPDVVDELLDFLGLILTYGAPIFGIVVLGLLIGRRNEHRHLRDLARREQALSHVKVTNL